MSDCPPSPQLSEAAERRPPTAVASCPSSPAASPAPAVARDQLDHCNGQRNVYKFGATALCRPARFCDLIHVVRTERARVAALVVSAMDPTPAQLLRAVAFAAAGDASSALNVVDKLQAETLSIATATLRELHVKPVDDMEALIVGLWTPLRELLVGMSLLQEQTAPATDAVLAFGEQLTAALVARLLTQAGIDALYVDARDWLLTDETHGSANVLFDESRTKLRQQRTGWSPEVVPVITGSIGCTRNGRTTTLGRNGADYTATLVGAMLRADYVVIHTDTAGVMTADPDIVDRAVALSHLSHYEALELAMYSTRMFHARTMVPLIKSGVPMFIRNMMDPSGRGTYISAVGRTGTHETCTTSLEHLAIIEARTRILQDGSSRQANIGARVTKVLEALRIPVWLSIRGAHGQAISVVVPLDKEVQARAAIDTELSAEIASHEVDCVNSESPVTMLSIVTEDLSKVPHHRTRFFGSLADADIEVLAVGQGTSLRSLSCVIRGIDTKVAVRRVHDAFNVDCLVTNVVLLGCNHIALDVVHQLHKLQERYWSQHKARVNIVGFNPNCDDFLYDPKGFAYEELASCLEACRSTNAVMSASSANEPTPYAGAPSLTHLNELQDLAIPIVLDCSGQSNTQDLYSACIERGIHVVASNARSVCRLPSTLWRESTATTTRTESGRTFFMHTSTVGASLPIIDTLGNILRTGDRILGIDTSLSGSMNFVANEVMKGKKLSEAVGEVLCRGYCERDPREDFTGTDMVAKVVVLARALGVHLHESEVRVEPFIPHSVLDTIAWSHDMEVDDIVTGLEAYDEEFRERYYMPAVSESKRLCYVASINLAGSLSIEATIRPLLVSEDHPVYYTKDNEVAFGVSSVQYPNPLVLKGSGTGASASATGVLRDVLTILSRLSGNNVRA
ncbi:unnamed protein product [Hyaloperonospora brassicae]|uniref:Homoserine dehydrogenase n=1 Tax=Hyaloperonospora brassicae TaxID=162125 RepID=A0AAV0V1H5_HYABA|nr:unnamed protein product [Hyaloperonospora brassicae]